MAIKTAIGSPDEDPKKKKNWKHPEDKSDLKPKSYDRKMGHDESLYKRKDTPAKKEDPEYDKFKKDYLKEKSHLNGKGYHGYQAPDGSWHGHPLSESAIKAHHKWSKMTREQQQKHTERQKKDRFMMQKQSDKQHPHEKPGSPKKDWDHKKKKPGYPTDHLFSEMAKKKDSVKVEPLKKKTTESVLKEKMEAKEKLKKKSPTSRARQMLPKTKKKKK